MAAPAEQYDFVEHGSHVFVDDRVAAMLDDKILDARVDDERQISFTLLP